MRKFGSGHDRQMLLGCFPFSKPQRMKGAWVFGFEVNGFYEGQPASLQLLQSAAGVPLPPAQRPKADASARLEWDPHTPVDGKLRAFQIDLIGRRDTCHAESQPVIVVDRIISAQLKAVFP